MPREQFQQRLDQLRDDIVRMGSVVSTRLQKVLVALETDNEALASRIADTDHEINDLYLDLESDCIELFALQQPVAGDLRFLTASFKILTDLERIADLAANLAGSVPLADDTLFAELAIRELAETAVEMLDDAMAAYTDGDADACFAVAERDDDLDGRCERAAQQVIRTLVDEHTGGDDLEAVLESVTHVLLTIRDIERIGDHAVNIAARTLYMVDTDDALIY